MIDKGIKFLYNMLPNVAFAKLYVAYNFIDEQQIDEYLSTSIAGEILD